MTDDGELVIDDEFLFYSVIYSSITVIFGMAVLSKFLTHEFRFGLRSLLSLGVLFVGEPVCHFLLKGASGVLIFGLGCLLIYSMLPSSHLSAQGKAVLITGCDSGFGHALAKKLDTIGMKVFACCLDDDGPGAVELKNTCSSELKVLRLDITDQELVDYVHDYVSRSVGDTGLWGLVNNAGIWVCGDIEMTSQAMFEKILNTNFLGTVRMTKTFIPLLRKTKGRIVNVSSFVGKVPMEMFSAYAASKHAIEGFSDILRLEMRKFDISISIVEPGGFKTNPFIPSVISARKEQMWQEASQQTREFYGREHLDDVYHAYEKLSRTLPEDITPVIRAMRSGLLSKRPRERYPCGRFVEPMLTIYPLIPIWIADKISVAIGMPRFMKLFVPANANTAQ